MSDEGRAAAGLAVPAADDGRWLGARWSQADVLESLAERLLTWHAVHGRHDLPWQASRDPYRVWLSELMLQQTQVRTVLGYYDRFLTRFPDVQALAQAPLDDVMAAWSGLGYYSRARNLHRCAQIVVEVHGGRFPDSAKALAELPGIGPSTAAAIAAFCFGERVAILDGNVKRVLSRALAFEGDLAQTAATRTLWGLATEALPREDLARAMPIYTQAIMDLGATVCTTRQPRCTACPLASGCRALAEGQPEHFPVRSRRLKRSAQHWQLLLAVNSRGEVWLTRRPLSGVWAGLYALPMFASDHDLDRAWRGSNDDVGTQGDTIKHVLTHLDLYLQPVTRQWMGAADAAPVDDGGAWHALADALALGLPVPVRRLLAERLG